MVTKTFLDKSNTIFKNSGFNYGLNPISMASYGLTVSRFLIHFDIEKLVKAYKDGTYQDLSKVTHKLKMTNCGSLNKHLHNDKICSSDYKGGKERAGSFDLILFTIPKSWDAGTGFDSPDDVWIKGKPSLSKNGSTWYQSQNGNEWDEEGIYTNETLSKELGKYNNGEESVIISAQHFASGCENIEFDISDYINSLIVSEAKKTPYAVVKDIVFGDTNITGRTDTQKIIPNNGLCIAFTPCLEETKTTLSQYVGFFNNNTNTFFEPYIESTYNVSIIDDRYKFCIGKTNRLYFYSCIGGSYVNLDEMPTCKIDDVSYPVKCDVKGCYYAEVLLPSSYGEEEILTDVWSNIKYNGKDFNDVEMEFTTMASNNYAIFGAFTPTHTNLEPTITGIDDYAKLNQYQKIQLNCIFKTPYTNGEYELVDNAEYRIYVMDGDREYDVYPWQEMLTIGKTNCFYLNTDEMLPKEYLIDVRAKFGEENLVYKKVKVFSIVNNRTNDKI